LVAVSAILVSSSAFAYLPVSSITTLALPVYGVYMSADPTCVTGMVATIPLSKTPQTINFASGPVIGTADTLPATIGCVIIVVGNSLSNAWSAGHYDSLTTQSNPDTLCDAGGSTTGQVICGGGSGQTVSWPAQITTDAAAIGLTLATGTCVGTTTEVVPLVLSTNSICSGNSAIDASIPACNVGNGTNNWTMPTTTNDATEGTKLTAPAVTGNLKFVVNPTNTLGVSQHNSDPLACGNISAPAFSFQAD
jgi:hypothetical protein